MNWRDTIFKTILSQIENSSATCDWGNIGTDYQHVLVIRDDKIISIGDFLYSIPDRGLGNLKDAKTFGILCNKYLRGEIDRRPTWCFVNDELIPH